MFVLLSRGLRSIEIEGPLIGTIQVTRDHVRHGFKVISVFPYLPTHMSGVRIEVVSSVFKRVSRESLKYIIHTNLITGTMLSYKLLLTVL